MNKLIIHTDLGRQKISRHVYGHFIEHLGRCVYEGLWVGEDSPIANTRGFRNDVVEALKKLNMPNLRWPGGCFADTYHWMDAVGPKEKRPGITNIHWGGEVENNACGTHEFLDLCAMLGAEPYIAGNVGSGTVREMAEWIEYVTMPGDSPMARLRRANGRDEPWALKFWGVGNENWGCGGQMRAEYYADLYRHYGNYCRHFTPNNKLYKVACGLDAKWNDTLLREAGSHMDGLSVHYYTLPGTWEKKGASTDFAADEWKLTLQKAANIDGFIKETSAIMDRYDPQKRIGIVMDEWGTWYDVEPGTNPGFLFQQNTMRDALVAGLTFNIFHSHAERMHVANIAQTVNVLQAMVLTEGAKMVLTPTYHVFEMYKVHQDATLLPTNLEAADYVPAVAKASTTGAVYGPRLSALPQISASASRDSAGKIHLSLCNLHHEESAEIQCDFRGGSVSQTTGRILTAAATNSMNVFDEADVVKPAAFAAFKFGSNGLTVALPARSVVVLEIQ